MGLDNPIHLLFLLVILLLVFGAKRLPEMGRGLGDGLRGFKDAVSGVTTPDVNPISVHEPALHAAPQVDPTVTAETAERETVGAGAPSHS